MENSKENKERAIVLYKKPEILQNPDFYPRIKMPIEIDLGLDKLLGFQKIDLLAELKNLESIYDNKLQEFPENIDKLSNLELFNNQLKELPKDILLSIKLGPPERFPKNIDYSRGLDPRFNPQEVAVINGDDDLRRAYDKHSFYGSTFCQELSPESVLKEWAEGNEIHYGKDGTYVYCIIKYNGVMPSCLKIFQKYNR